MYKYLLMKYLPIVFFLCAGVEALAAANAVTAENPPFDFNTHANVTVERIVSDSAATTLYMAIYPQRNHSIGISSEAYIHADGRKYPLKSADSVPLDKELYPDESEKIIFLLTFPPSAGATEL